MRWRAAFDINGHIVPTTCKHSDVRRRASRRRGNLTWPIQNACGISGKPAHAMPSGVWCGARVMTPSEFSTPPTRSGRVLGPMIARAAGGTHTRISRGAKHIVIMGGSRVKDSLDFIDFVCDRMPAMQLPVLPSESAAVHVFTDAEGKKRSRRTGASPSGHLGFVVMHPTLGVVHAQARVPDGFTRLLDSVRMRDQYIGQYELLAAITPFVSLDAKWFANRPVVLWIDNSPAIGGLLKGYSGKPDCARLVNMFHFAFARVGAASLWID